MLSSVDDSFVLSKADLDAAIKAGALEPVAADRLVSFVLKNASPLQTSSEDEQFRLVTGFSDIFVTIGLALFLGALTYLTGGAWPVALPVAAWVLAEIFTRQRRMALPSIVLLLVFVGSVFAAALALLFPGHSFSGLDTATDGLQAAGSAVIAAVAAGAHWWRFRVPVTIAAGCAALVVLVAGLAGAFAPSILQDHAILVFLPLGLLVFALAMRFDMSDVQRRTRRTDIAFWLHLLAAPLIVHTVVWSFTDLSSIGASEAVAICIMFVVLSVVALVIDRRAMLVSSLIYLGYAIGTIVPLASLGSSSSALAVLLVGAVVLLLSLAWHPLRNALLKVVPQAIRARVPAAHSTSLKPRQA